jgi:hypothetical protein
MNKLVVVSTQQDDKFKCCEAASRVAFPGGRQKMITADERAISTHSENN